MGPHPSPSGSAHECTATPRISLLWTTSLACDIVAQTNHMCPIYMDQEEGNGVPDTLHTDKHTHMRVRVLADHRDVGLLRNTGIDPLPPPSLTIQKAVQHCILPSASKTPGSFPLKQQSGSVYAIILTLQFVNGCSPF